MLEGLLNFILDLFFWLIGIIGSVIIYPVQVAIVAIFPDLGTFLNDILNFLGTYIAPMISFIKELILEVSCLPSSLYTLLISFAFTRYLIAPGIRAIKLIVNMWKLKSGGLTK